MQYAHCSQPAQKTRKYPVTTKAEVNRIETFKLLDELLVSLIHGVLNVLAANVFKAKPVSTDVRWDRSSSRSLTMKTSPTATITLNLHRYTMHILMYVGTL